jgi:hypothetical protein
MPFKPGGPENDQQKTNRTGNGYWNDAGQHHDNQKRYIDHANACRRGKHDEALLKFELF